MHSLHVETRTILYEPVDRPTVGGYGRAFLQTGGAMHSKSVEDNSEQVRTSNQGEEHSSAHLNLLNLSLDTVRIEAFQHKAHSGEVGHQSSGTLMSDKGDIVTVDHGLADSNAATFDIQFSNGAHRAAELFARDESSGLAVFRLQGGEKTPVAYHPVKFATSDLKQDTPTISNGFVMHSSKMSSVHGYAGQDKILGDIDESVISRAAPNVDRTMLVHDVVMKAQSGLAGAAIASATTGEIAGVLQFGMRSATSYENGPPVSAEVILTPAADVKSFLDRIDS